MSKPFRILSLSGGGMRGVFSAAVLCELESKLRHQKGDEKARLVDQFDLIVGTSTGGLLGLGLAFGKSPEELLAVYKAKGKRIFPRHWLNLRWLRGGPFFFPYYSQGRLREIVEAMVPKDKKLWDARPHVILPTMRADSGEITILKTQIDSTFYKDQHISAVDAGLATSAAPVAFGRMRTMEHGDLIDGGLWANTPVLVGLIEAQRRFNRHGDDIYILSIGTTCAPLSPRRLWHWGGLLEYFGLAGGRLAELLFAGQRELAIQAANLILKPGHLTHVDATLGGAGISLMDATNKSIFRLEAAGRSAGQKQAEAISKVFFQDAPIAAEAGRV